MKLDVGWGVVMESEGIRVTCVSSVLPTIKEALHSQNGSPAQLLSAEEPEPAGRSPWRHAEL